MRFLHFVGRGQAAKSVKAKSPRETSRRKLRRSSSVFTALCETCEPRVMLRAQLDLLIPASIAPNSAPQTLLAPGSNNLSLTSSSSTTQAVARYRFVVNDATPGQFTQFKTGGTNTGQPDAAIALYDASGNRIVLQDTDSFG